MEEFGSVKERKQGLVPYLSQTGAWALSIGTAIGWGSFVLTSNIYLASAGPLGSTLGMLVGMIIMLFVSRNYHYLMNRYPDSGGVYTYAKEVFGHDYGFLTFWFVSLTYLSILWANFTSVPLFARNFFGDLFRVGLLYTIFGYDIYLGEVLLTVAAILLTGFLCIKRERLAVRFVIVLAVTFVAGITFCFIAALMKRDAGAYPFEPAFMPDSGALSQVIRICLMAPWAFIGFENISHSAREFAFDRKKTFKVLSISVVITTLLYIFVTLLSITAFPSEYGSWTEYLGNLDKVQGVKGLPAFFAAQYYLGDAGVFLMAASLFSLVMTSLICNTVALSRLFYTVAKDEVLPDRFAKLNLSKNPEGAVILVILLSLGIPLIGRTAVGWIVDVTTIGAIIVYGTVSAAAYKLASREGSSLERCTGLAGMGVMSFFGLLELFPALFETDMLATETYFLFTAWSILGFIFFRNVLSRDYGKNFGRSIIVWVALLGLILFMATSWMRQSNKESIYRAIAAVHNYDRNLLSASGYKMSEAEFMDKVRENIRSGIMRNDSVVLLLVIFSLGMVFSNYTVVQRRMEQTEKELGLTKTMAYRDSLTGVKSKMAFDSFVSDMDKLIRAGSLDDFAVVVCDINGLKQVNDTQGHVAGDNFIRAACALICVNFKHSPVFRTGGDEFVAVLRGQDFENRQNLMEAMDKRMEDNLRKGEVVVAASHSVFDKDNDVKFHDVFERADSRMYERKKWLKRMDPKAGR